MLNCILSLIAMQYLSIRKSGSVLLACCSLLYDYDLWKKVTLCSHASITLQIQSARHKPCLELLLGHPKLRLRLKSPLFYDQHTSSEWSARHEGRNGRKRWQLLSMSQPWKIKALLSPPHGRPKKDSERKPTNNYGQEPAWRNRYSIYCPRPSHLLFLYLVSSVPSGVVSQ